MYPEQPPEPDRPYYQQSPEPQQPYYQQPPDSSWQQQSGPYQPQAPVPYQPQGPYPPQQYPRHGDPPQPPRRHAHLDSEEVVLAAPMSFTGSAERLWKLTRNAPANGLASAAVYTGVVLLIAVAWAAVLCWYFFFGLWLVPYRLIRRGQRKRRREDLRHREMLTMMHQMGQQQPPPYGPGGMGYGGPAGPPQGSWQPGRHAPGGYSDADRELLRSSDELIRDMRRQQRPLPPPHE